MINAKVLELKVEHQGNYATFLVLDITMEDGIVLYKLFDKTDKVPNFVDNKVERWMPKWVLQENKARQIFQETNISYPLIGTRTCSYQGVRNVHCLENLTRFVFL